MFFKRNLKGIPLKIIITTIVSLRHELLPYPPHSPDLATTNLSLLVGYKKIAVVKKYSNNTEKSFKPSLISRLKINCIMKNVTENFSDHYNHRLTLYLIK